jgi:hypothetical protein
MRVADSNGSAVPMPDGIRWVGLDVHAHESTIAIVDQATGELSTRRVVGRPHERLPWLRGVKRPARMVYEAGPTGYGLARRARADGIELVVCAPGRADARTAPPAAVTPFPRPARNDKSADPTLTS